CIAGGPQGCEPGEPGPEACNGVDDDCDGLTDEDLGETTCGVGGCQRTVRLCLGGSSQECVPGEPVSEICGNGIDEDCNGADETCALTQASIYGRVLNAETGVGLEGASIQA